MPIFAPLADTVGIPRFVIVTTYQFGQYAMLFLAPTGLVMATLQMLNMRYSHWFRFVWPVVAFVLIFGGGVLITQVLINSELKCYIIKILIGFYAVRKFVEILN